MQFRLLGEDGRLKLMDTILRFLRSDVSTGLKIIVIDIVLAPLSMLPLLIYIGLGPADGNPIGLGLLAVAGMLLGGLAFLLGLMWLLIEYFIGRSRAGQP